MLKKRGVRGDFYFLENEGHLLSEPFKEKIKELLKN